MLLGYFVKNKQETAKQLYVQVRYSYNSKILPTKTQKVISVNKFLQNLYMEVVIRQGLAGGCNSIQHL